MRKKKKNNPKYMEPLAFYLHIIITDEDHFFFCIEVLKMASPIFTCIWLFFFNYQI